MYICIMKQNKYTTERFIEKARKLHNNKFTYENSIYTGSLNKIIITCPVHGDFEQAAFSHLQGFGCHRCQIDKSRLNKDIFIQRATLIHGNKYDYADSIYIDTNTKINIKCPIHGEFYQRVPDHLKGRGCNKCAKRSKKGYTRTQWIEFCNKAKKSSNTLYIIRCFNRVEGFIKIGLTTTSVRNRFLYKLPYSYEILKEIKGSPDFIYDKEKELHKLCKKYKYKPLISFAGESECFTLNCLSILNLI